MSDQRTIVIASGGTGGHLYPTIAVADALKSEMPDLRILFIGTADRIEAREVPRAGYAFEAIRMEAPKKSPASLLRFPFMLMSAVMRSRMLLKKYNACAVLCGGAYLSVPVGIAARTLSLPLALLEINSIAGKANKLLSRWATKVFLAYPESRAAFPNVEDSAMTISGTPVRAAFGQKRIAAAEARKSFGLPPESVTMLVFGGSLGARTINEAVAESADAITRSGYNILWQVGKGKDIEEYRRRFSDNTRISIHEYIYDMESAFAAAELVTSRAGASSLAELASVGKPAILVPWSGAAENHQEANARAFEACGAAIVLRDNEVRGKLLETSLRLLQDSEQLQKMSDAMKLRENKDAPKIVSRWLAMQCK